MNGERLRSETADRDSLVGRVWIDHDEIDQGEIGIEFLFTIDHMKALRRQLDDAIASAERRLAQSASGAA